CVAEMKTGEGKTLAATLPTYLNALSLNSVWVERATQEWGSDLDQWKFKPLDGIPVGQGVHIVTSNDYLAQRDARWMASIYETLGLSSGVLQSSTQKGPNPAFLVRKVDSEGKPVDRHQPVDQHQAINQHQLELASRKQVYQADITYGTANEFGFDFLRDRMVLSKAKRVQRGHHYAIVDEVDNVLIDEARTPLILSGPSGKNTAHYQKVSDAIKLLAPEHYKVDENDWSAYLTPEGEIALGKALNLNLVNPDLPELSDPIVNQMWGFVIQSLRAQFLYQKDVHYILRHDLQSDTEQVVIINSGGRSMFGRSWSDGLHQSIQAKEGVPITSENMTYESIAVQSYFRQYDKLAGMTGTTDGVEDEFKEVYGMETVIIPSHFENLRVDKPDEIYWTEEAKLRAIVEDVVANNKNGRPVLVGTTSIQKSNQLFKLITAVGIECQLLNAHSSLEEEARVIANAGAFGVVTIATNMAGRGVDIKLGGESATKQEAQKVRDLGGLYVVGVDHNEILRIDGQLRGRAGRQGDLGLSCFYASMEDEWLRKLKKRSSKFRNFLEKNKGAAGHITDPRDIEIILRFINEAQQIAAEDEATARNRALTHNEILDKQREAFGTQQNAIMTKDEAEFDKDLKRMADVEVRRRIKEMMVGKHDLRLFLMWMEFTQPMLEIDEEIDGKTDKEIVNKIFPSWSLSLLLEKVTADVVSNHGVNSLDELDAGSSKIVVEGLLKVRQDLLKAEQKEVLRIARSQFDKIDFENKLEVYGLLTTISLMMPGDAKFNIEGLSTISEKKMMWALVTINIIIAFRNQSKEINKYGELDQNKVFSREDVLVFAKTILLDEMDGEHRLKTSHLWMVENALEGMSAKEIEQEAMSYLDQAWKFIEEHWSDNKIKFIDFKRSVLLRSGNQAWTKHLADIEILQKIIELEAYAGRDTLVAYKQRASDLFEQMIGRIRSSTLNVLFRPWYEDEVFIEAITKHGSLPITALLEQVEAQKDVLKPEVFITMHQLLTRAMEASGGIIDLSEVLNTREDALNFSENLFKIIDQQIVVFFNYFVDQNSEEAGGFDVAYSSRIKLPRRIKLLDGGERELNQAEQKDPEHILSNIVQLRSSQQRLMAVLDNLETTGVTAIVDHYTGVTQNKGDLKDKIDKIQKHLGKLWKEVLDFLYDLTYV
ncbi:hypothetical protein KJ628_01540, partial [Patescibacteria group bacterium]|nr:hypothetical protein [Patescibacteria group bacterium]